MRTGGVRLGQFYARRIRRLLPAAFLVLVVTAVLVFVFLPYPRWERNGWEILASATYVENWFLSTMSVNYSALNDAASAAQHFWSLSVEEQFYLVWPWLLLFGLWVASRRRPATRDTRFSPRALVVVVAVVGALSLAASVWFTAESPNQAYFVTFTRAWEFAIGGAVALLGTRIAWSPILRGVVGLLGFAGVVLAAFTFNSSTPFPGYAALLPTLGTAAVIAAGTGAQRQWHDVVTAARPVQWLGDVSYSLYLWHWPLLVVAPFVLDRELTFVTRCLVLAAALILAALSRRFVEVPAQSWSGWRGTVRRPVLFMIAGMLAIGALTGSMVVSNAVQTAADRPPATVTSTPCRGPAALAPGARCPDAFTTVGDTVMTKKNEYFFTPEECTWEHELQYGDLRTTMRCDFSAGAKDPRQVWLIGDSHAQQWQGAVYDLARQGHWKLTTSYLGGCPVADVEFQGFRSAWGPDEAQRCRTWSHDVADRIESERPALVITAMASRHQLVDDGSGRGHDAQFIDGLQAFWKRWDAKGTRVLAVADPPLNGEVRPPDCLLHNQEDPLACARPRTDAQPADPLAEAARTAHLPGVSVLDLTDRFCDATRCFAAVGGVPVYYDADHLNLEYVRLLDPLVKDAVDRLLPSG